MHPQSLMSRHALEGRPFWLVPLLVGVALMLLLPTTAARADTVTFTVIAQLPLGQLSSRLMGVLSERTPLLTWKGGLTRYSKSASPVSRALSPSGE